MPPTAIHRPPIAAIVAGLGSAAVGWPSPFEPLSSNFSLYALWRWNEMRLGALRRNVEAPVARNAEKADDEYLREIFEIRC